MFADVRPELDGGSKEEGMWVHREPGDPGTARTGFQVTVSEVAAWRWWGDLDFVRTGSWGGFRGRMQESTGPGAGRGVTWVLKCRGGDAEDNGQRLFEVVLRHFGLFLSGWVINSVHQT